MYVAPDFVKVDAKVKDVFRSYCIAVVDHGGIFEVGSCKNDGQDHLMDDQPGWWQCWNGQTS